VQALALHERGNHRLGAHLRLVEALQEGGDGGGVGDDGRLGRRGHGKRGGAGEKYRRQEKPVAPRLHLHLNPRFPDKELNLQERQ